MDEEKYKVFLEAKEKVKEGILNEEPKYPFELFGIECGEGWKHLYEPILEYIVKFNEEHKDNPIEVHQIKEKFGELRVYLSYYTDELSKMIDNAEEESEKTCEICGKHINGPIVEHNWIYPMCDECYNEMDERRKVREEEIRKKIREKEEKNEDNQG